jgi:hypothetical protein
MRQVNGRIREGDADFYYLQHLVPPAAEEACTGETNRPFNGHNSSDPLLGKEIKITSKTWAYGTLGQDEQDYQESAESGIAILP